MQVRCIKPFGNAVIGSVAEVPDGAAVDPEHWEVLPDAPASPPAAAVAPATASGLPPVTPLKEGM